MSAHDPTPTGRTPADLSNRTRALVWVGVGFLIFLYLFSPFTQVFLGWFVDFEDNRSHVVHEVTFGALFSIMFVGVLAQLRQSTRRFPGLLQAAVAAVALAVSIGASTGPEWYSLLYVAPVVVMIWLHPDRGSIRRYRLNPYRPLVWLMAIVTIPLLGAFNTEFQKAVKEAAGHQAHWAGMAAFTLTLLIIGWMAALRFHGWPIMAVTTGASILFYSVLSLLYRFDSSARGGATAIIGIAWSLGFLWAARSAPPVPALRRSDPKLPAPPRRLGTLATSGIAVVFVLGGAIGSTIARSVTPPPVPHGIESTTPSYCISCHTTGAQGAPEIDLDYHGDGGPFPRCTQCHDTRDGATPIASGQSFLPGHGAALDPSVAADVVALLDVGESGP